ncbi:MAG: hypothetical protein GEU68_00155 [Actinobacteria bacterium]|nr:hypothetical protein [Actinomycetota bacterium]
MDEPVEHVPNLTFRDLSLISNTPHGLDQQQSEPLLLDRESAEGVKHRVRLPRASGGEYCRGSTLAL